MNQPIIKVSNLKKAYKKQEVLKGISFEVNKGEIIALLGENGAGKSTLINIINRIITPTDGEAVLYNNQLNENEVKNLTGVMLQNNILLDRLTVEEVINLSRSYYKNPNDYEELMDLAQLDELAHLQMKKLSGGQQRRLSFALALAGNPELIFLDEPTASMDAKSRQRLWKKIGDLKRTNKTIIVTSHNLEELEDIATRLLILQDGVIAFDGSISELRQTQGEGTIEFDTTLDAKVFSQINPIIRMEQQGNHFMIVTQTINEIVKQLMPMLDEIENLSIQQTSLNTLFAYFGQKEN